MRFVYLPVREWKRSEKHERRIAKLKLMLEPAHTMSAENDLDTERPQVNDRFGLRTTERKRFEQAAELKLGHVNVDV